MDIQKQFEETTNHAAWINSDLYPSGRTYTNAYTEWLEKEFSLLSTKIKELEEKLKKSELSFPKATNEQKEGDWTYNVNFMTDIKDFVNDGGESVSLEGIELVLKYLEAAALKDAKAQ